MADVIIENKDSRSTHNNNTMSLTQGSILDLINETKDSTVFHPTVQVLDIRKISGTGEDRYRLIISDGRFYAQSMITTQLNSLVEENKLQKNAGKNGMGQCLKRKKAS